MNSRHSADFLVPSRALSTATLKYQYATFSWALYVCLMIECCSQPFYTSPSRSLLDEGGFDARVKRQ